MEVQGGISREKLRAKVGSTLDVVVDGSEGNVTLARGKSDAPEIDGVVRVRNARGAKPGDRLTVRVTASTEHDLEATISPRQNRR
jgi:ribosomal protein S12 methylthiotransferase